MKNFLFISIEESFFIIIIAILVFGPKKIPDIARGLGEGIRYLKNAKTKIKNEIIKNNIDQPVKKKEISDYEKKKGNKHMPPYSIKRNN
ncbi:twin-arginine translocase TatA/TatE family subunit [Blattabacterium sp. (Blaberus giganteus)]|uniref:Sec-independent protein translocase subunit TatA/TatB n=1 Tax=Blattabacterium sp. (Blaberus giganteus) TaxID=1186051 RepID=UPI00025F701B|nr:twin-arginine translocase TatA/TatE family subunit [Blattabacterium sp. (Blaberus giganteus)]AFJ90960.1 Sec-independent-protein-translocase TatA/E [Blattabacterium sp. (Blaberus giganteus)]